MQWSCRASPRSKFHTFALPKDLSSEDVARALNAAVWRTWRRLRDLSDLAEWSQESHGLHGLNWVVVSSSRHNRESYPWMLLILSKQVLLPAKKTLFTIIKASRECSFTRRCGFVLSIFFAGYPGNIFSDLPQRNPVKETGTHRHSTMLGGAVKDMGLHMKHDCNWNWTLYKPSRTIYTDSDIVQKWYDI